MTSQTIDKFWADLRAPCNWLFSSVNTNHVAWSDVLYWKPPISERGSSHSWWHNCMNMSTARKFSDSWLSVLWAVWQFHFPQLGGSELSKGTWFSSACTCESSAVKHLQEIFQHLQKWRLWAACSGFSTCKTGFARDLVSTFWKSFDQVLAIARALTKFKH